MPYYRRVGETPAKRHRQFRDGTGQLYAEELMSSVGFSEESALLYHRRAPTQILAAELVDVEPEQAARERAGPPPTLPAARVQAGR